MAEAGGLEGLGQAVAAAPAPPGNVNVLTLLSHQDRVHFSIDLRYGCGILCNVLTFERAVIPDIRCPGISYDDDGFGCVHYVQNDGASAAVVIDDLFEKGMLQRPERQLLRNMGGPQRCGEAPMSE